LILYKVFDGILEDEEPLIFSDLIYKGIYSVIRPYIQRLRRPLTARESEFNYNTSTIRILIEHLFSYILNL
jgi:hypothetical protein